MNFKTKFMFLQSSVYTRKGLRFVIIFSSNARLDRKHGGKSRLFINLYLLNKRRDSL